MRVSVGSVQAARKPNACRSQLVCTRERLLKAPARAVPLAAGAVAEEIVDVSGPANGAVPASRASTSKKVPKNLAAQHKTKVVCTIGPSTCSEESLLTLAQEGMDVVRLNMTHSDHAWHEDVINKINNLNKNGFNIAVMVDTEGSEAHLKAADPVRVETGETVAFTVRDKNPNASLKHFQVSYEGFVDDVRVGDYLMVDGGMTIVKVSAIEGPDVKGEVVEPGVVLSRANITLRRGKVLVMGNSSMLPTVTAKDWQDIDFAIEHKVNFVAISFVRDANIIANVRSYIEAQLEAKHPGHTIEIVAKVEAYDSIAALPEIINESDVIMVARSDLGAQIPLEDVPAVQKEIVFRCRQMGKPVIVASQLLNSMMEVPVPTRAEVADCADAVRQSADALMLSAETAVGEHPIKCVQVLRGVFTEVEEWVTKEKFGAMKYPVLATTPEQHVSEEICTAAANLAGQLGAKAILAYTHTGNTAGLVSRRRPDCPVVAITDSPAVLRRLSLRWGVVPLLMNLSEDPEKNVQETFKTVAEQDILESGDLVVVVSDIVTSDNKVRSIQLRHIV